LFTSRINETAESWNPDEINTQIGLTRMAPIGAGHIHFSAAALVQNRQGIADLLERETYRNSALVPATLWLRPADIPLPNAPRATLQCAEASAGTAGQACTVVITADPPGQPVRADQAHRLAIWARYGASQWVFHIASAESGTASIPRHAGNHSLDRVVISAVDRYGAEGNRTTIVVSK
jgi:hypothetical protein